MMSLVEARERKSLGWMWGRGLQEGLEWVWPVLMMSLVEGRERERESLGWMLGRGLQRAVLDGVNTGLRSTRYWYLQY